MLYEMVMSDIGNFRVVWINIGGSCSDKNDSEFYAKSNQVEYLILFHEAGVLLDGLM
jgi:hypothetical protein